MSFLLVREEHLLPFVLLPAVCARLLTDGLRDEQVENAVVV